MGYSDSPSKIDQLSLYNHGNPFSTSLAITCSLILPRVPTLEIYYFKMSLFLKTAIIRREEKDGLGEGVRDDGFAPGGWVKVLRSRRGPPRNSDEHGCRVRLSLKVSEAQQST